MIKDRFFAETVTNQIEGLPVKERYGEHADEMVHEADTPFDVSGNKHFGVTCRCKRKIQLLPEQSMVVDLSVKA
jgi:hypothetical protein